MSDKRQKWKKWATLSREEKIQRLLYVHGSVFWKPGRASRLSRWYRKILIRDGL